ncbi:globin domain-containing protein [Pelagibius sp. Alg239-R121]|uniref:globin domain-containing protein n=1 Tax=Pelagibius sp. Alg239-R121 TaxID=2993448 RepID=UPI0024A68A29|nr:globin domain-containing protein [Pelagibius sp. Alg239-R121]
MALTADEVELIRSSFRRISRVSEQAADRFYGILFSRAPETRILFTTDLERQGAMLMSKLAVIVSELHNTHTLAPMLEGLALRHVAYGVKREHYPLAGTALLEAFSDMLGEDFTPEAKAAWEKAYTELADLMTSTAYVR